MKRTLLNTITALAGLSLTAAFSPSAQALLIVPTFDSSITGDPNSASIILGITNAIAQIDSYIANPITVDIIFQQSNVGVGSSSVSSYGIFYGGYISTLQNNQVLSAADTQALSTLPGGPNNPVNGSNAITLTSSLLQALGVPVSDSSTITLNTSFMNYLRTGPQDPSKADLQSVVMHEICETLGSGGQGSHAGTSDIGDLDLFRYSAPGVRSFSADPNASSYFSIDSGVTNLRNFNQNGVGDYGDWAVGATPHVQDAFATLGSRPDLDSVEITALDIIGYDLTPAGTALQTAVPEPTSLALMTAGLTAAASLRKRKKPSQNR